MKGKRRKSDLVRYHGVTHILTQCLLGKKGGIQISYELYVILQRRKEHHGRVLKNPLHITNLNSEGYNLMVWQVPSIADRTRIVCVVLLS